MITIKHKGDLKKTYTFLKKASKIDYLRILERYGQEGVNALSAATPVDSGVTANSWSYIIKKSRSSYTISWINSNIKGGAPIAILIQSGHGTRNGGYVIGIDYINPAMKPIFDKMADEAWREVTKK